MNKKCNLKKVLVVGSWAKEQITIENISMNPEIEIFSYMDIRNPGIISLVKDYHIGSLYDIDSIIKYAQDKKIDIVIITTASPLSRGLVDKLEDVGILAFGPNLLAARLESDKEFARKLLQKYMPSAIPKFDVFDNYQGAIQFSERFDWQVAVKPIGLTEGLGVKIFGDHLKDENDVKDYIQHIINKQISGSSRVIIEEKIEGEEFTIQCFVHKEHILPTPAVQDFKRLLPGEKGPNTASMGSYSQQGYLLPFMEEEDYRKAMEIISITLEGFQEETGKTCSGFLYGQFMLTAEGVKLIEYNFRPGDPEWLNTILILKNNILDIILSLLEEGEEYKKDKKIQEGEGQGEQEGEGQGEQEGEGQGEQEKDKLLLSFDNCVTVCKYIVPANYPEKFDQILDVSLDNDVIQKIKDLRYYYSCGLDDMGRLNVGTERGIAFIAKAPTIEEANEKVEKAISTVKGEFFYRRDIGTTNLIESKIDHIKMLRKLNSERIV